MIAKEREIKLTDRDLQILDMVSKGYSNREIAEELELSESSVVRLLILLTKIAKCVNRAHLVRWGFENNYLR